MKILLTGGTHSGKTSILKFLSKKGFKISNESAGENINMLINIFGLEGSQTRRKENFLSFQEMNIYSNIKRDLNNNSENLVFYDRGVFDWIASLKREGISIPSYILELVNNIKYDLIFITENLSYHDTRESTGRMLNQEKSDKWRQFIIEEYTKRFGKDKVIFVPYFKGDKNASIEKRAKFICHYVKFIHKKN